MVMRISREEVEAMKARGDASKDYELSEELAARARSFAIADSHCHIYPTKIAEKASAAVGTFYDIPMYAGKGDAETLLANGSKIGVSRYTVCSVATTVEQVDSIDRFIADQCAAHPEFLGLGAWHEDIGDVDALLDRTQELGLVGIKVHPDFQHVNIDDPRLLDLYAGMAERGMPLLVHMGDTRYEYSAPAKLAAVLERLDTLKVDAAHFGGYSVWDEAVAALAGSPAYYDLSSSLAYLEPDEACGLIEAYGVDKVMFGVDFPMWNHSAEFARTMALGLTDDEYRAIFHDNYERFWLPAL